MNFQSPAFTPMQPMGAEPTDRLNLTDRNLGELMQEVAGRGGLNVQFFYMRTRIECANPERNGQYRTRLCVAKMPKGDRLTVATRFITEEQAYREFPREFAMFKQYQDVPTQGTPLHELPGVTQSQISVLVIHNLRCIEDVAACDDALINQMGYDARQAKKLAVRWIENRKGNADLIAGAMTDAARDAELERTRKSLAEFERRTIELEAQLRAVMSMQGQAVTPASTGQVQMVDRPDGLPDALEVESKLLEGGYVEDNEGMDADPVAAKADPLGLKAGK